MVEWFVVKSIKNALSLYTNFQSLTAKSSWFFADFTWWKESRAWTSSNMLKEGILKENIDGEAILWAYQRLKKRSEERKILMVISV